MPTKHPWLKLYTGDILADEELKSCSLAARGLFLYMLSLMHRSVRRGYLCTANRQPMTLEVLARNTGISTEEAAHLSQELLTSGVFSVTDDGTKTIYSRRMVKESGLSEKRAEAGKKGGFATAKVTANGQQSSGKGVGNPLTVSSDSFSSSGEEKPTGHTHTDLPQQKASKKPAKEEDDPLTDDFLAGVWVEQCARARSDDRFKIAFQVGNTAAQGVSRQAILEAINGDRDRMEWYSDLHKRLVSSGSSSIDVDEMAEKFFGGKNGKRKDV